MAFGTQGHAAFATFLILCPTSFFLGILFSLFPYDYPLLWTSAPCPSEAFTSLEAHYILLHNSPLIIQRILHIVVGVGLLGFFIKLYRPTESNKLFDGASLMMYMCGVIIYIANIIRGMRIIASGKYEDEVVAKEVEVGGGGADTPLGRDDSLRVMAASNTILALVLMGVLVLQAGQWYAERKDIQELEKTREDETSNSGGRSTDGSRHKSPTGSKKRN